MVPNMSRIVFQQDRATAHAVKKGSKSSQREASALLGEGDVACKEYKLESN